jgi:hypothetical protein
MKIIGNRFLNSKFRKNHAFFFISHNIENANQVKRCETKQTNFFEKKIKRSSLRFASFLHESEKM